MSATDLDRFLRQPVRFFLDQRFGVRIPERDSVTEEFEPIELSRLEDYTLREALLEDRTSPNQLMRSGALAAGFIGASYADAVGAEVRAVRETLETLHGRYGDALAPVTVHQAHAGLSVQDDIVGVLGPDTDGVHGLLFGTANPLHDNDQPRLHRLTGLWVRYLLLSAQGISVRATAVGSDGTITFEPRDADAASATLTTLLEMVARGLCEPLPIECKSALRAYDDGRLIMEAARDAYDGQGNQPGQVDWAPEVARFYPLFAAMESRGFEAVAAALYTPMVAACR